MARPDVPKASSQFVFFIRHAESRWNQAQRASDIVGMYKENDHGLSERGREQAEALRASIANSLDNISRAAQELPQEFSCVLSNQAEYESQEFLDGVLALQGLTQKDLIGKPCVLSDAFGISIEQGADFATVRFPVMFKQKLRAKAFATWEERFLNPSICFSSPLTRAIETGVIALEDVLANDGRELVCMLAAREKKNFGGADTKGVAYGEEIRSRVEHELDVLYPVEPLDVLPERLSRAGRQAAHHAMQAALVRTPSFEERQCRRKSLSSIVNDLRIQETELQGRWWNTVAESHGDFQARLSEFLRQIRTCGQERVIVVGHSHFFRAVFGVLSPKERTDPVSQPDARFQRVLLCKPRGNMRSPASPDAWNVEEGSARTSSASRRSGGSLRSLRPPASQVGSSYRENHRPLASQFSKSDSAKSLAAPEDATLRDEALMDHLRTELLPNCGVVGLHLEWIEDLTKPTVSEAVALFGTEEALLERQRSNHVVEARPKSLPPPVSRRRLLTWASSEVRSRRRLERLVSMRPPGVGELLLEVVLDKKSPNQLAGWQRRTFRLHSRALLYSKPDTWDPSENQIVWVRDLLSIHRQDLQLDLVTSGRTYKLKATSPDLSMSVEEALSSAMDAVAEDSEETCDECFSARSAQE